MLYVGIAQVRSDGRTVDAECSIDVFYGEPCLVIESSGGANPKRGITRRNPDYNQLLGLVLERLASRNVEITRILLDSTTVAAAPIDDRVVRLDQKYPVTLAALDIDSFRRDVQREVASMYRDPASVSSGNGQKKIRIVLSRAVSPDELMYGGERSLLPGVDDYGPGLTETEKNYVRAARIGQGRFRQDLFEQFGGTCPITGISNSDLLIASHIKPWKACTNAERLDPKNGILLSAMLDRLFDRGLISFSAVGDMLISPRMSDHDRAKCGITESSRLSLSQQSMHYMEYHRRIEYKAGF